MPAGKKKKLKKRIDPEEEEEESRIEQASAMIILWKFSRDERKIYIASRVSGFHAMLVK